MCSSFYALVLASPERQSKKVLSIPTQMKEGMIPPHLSTVYKFIHGEMRIGKCYRQRWKHGGKMYDQSDALTYN
jgi:hypothetical protein